MYRILDLISEQGSGGLGGLYRLFSPPTTLISLTVDKIISHRSGLPSGDFINTVCPGAIRLLTKVNFKALG